MKKIMLSLSAPMLALMTLLPASCVKEQVETLPANGPQITALTPSNPDTRTFLDDSLNVVWNAGDEITVFRNTRANHRYVFTGKDGDASGSFNYVPGTPSYGDATDYIYGVYPYDAATTLNAKGQIAVSIPSRQEYAEKGFAKGANVMVAASEEPVLQFKNLCGYAEVKLYGKDVAVKTLSLESNAREFIAGDVLVSVTPDAAPTFEYDGPGETVVTLTAAEPVVLGKTEEEATSFWFMLSPNVLEEGFTLSILDEDGEVIFEKVTEKSLEIERSTVIHMKAVEVVLPRFVDLQAQPLTWTAGQDWTDAKLLPDTDADIAYAEWTWNNGAEPVTYPEGYPVLDVNRSMNRVRCVWKDDALMFHVPVLSIPAGKTLVFNFAWRGGSKAPACWTVEASLDGTTWTPMNLTGQTDGTTAATYKDKDGAEKTAPLFLTKKDTAFPFEATLTATEDIVKQPISVRIRAIDILEVNGTVYASTPTSNSNCHIYVASFTYGNDSFAGPTLSVR